MYVGVSVKVCMRVNVFVYISVNTTVVRLTYVTPKCNNFSEFRMKQAS